MGGTSTASSFRHLHVNTDHPRNRGTYGAPKRITHRTDNVRVRKARVGVIPVNVSAPAVSGTPAVGQTLSASTGTWTGAGSYNYQWQKGAVNIGGATGPTYLVAAGDAASSIRVGVAGVNTYGAAATVYSTPVAVP